MNKKIEYWELIAECIVTEQMAPDGIAKWFNNKKFYSWFKRKYR